jgi:hypothetical protein
VALERVLVRQAAENIAGKGARNGRQSPAQGFAERGAARKPVFPKKGPLRSGGASIFMAGNRGAHGIWYNKGSFLWRKSGMQNFRAVIRDYLAESFKSVLPVAGIVLALCFSIAPIPNGTFLSFLAGTVFLVFGMSLFNLGAQTAMVPIGEHIGAFITKSRKLWLLVAVSYFIGFCITIAEPDLQVLANQIPNVPNALLVTSVAAGVGLFLVTALLRILFGVPIRRILLGCYGAVFLMAAFVPKEFLAIAFDAGGVTTGPMTVPFIMAIGIGAASMRSDSNATSDSFGLVALSSIGPILTVMVLGLLYNSAGGSQSVLMPAEAANTREMWAQFVHPSTGVPHYIWEVFLAFAPITAFFLFFHLVGLRLEKQQFIKILIGLVYTFAGLVLFLAGVNVGFMPAGYLLGELLAGLEHNWIVVPIAMAIGYFIVTAEPAVHVLNKQVEEISSGAIPEKAMRISLSIGMCISLGLSMIRILSGIPILWFLVPGYAAALAFAFFVPPIFTAIAFDSGGVASGPMTATFLLPLAIGVASRLEGRAVSDAFGVVAMVAMTPLITIQIMGLVYTIRQSIAAKAALAKEAGPSEEAEDTGIIE